VGVILVISDFPKLGIAEGERKDDSVATSALHFGLSVASCLLKEVMYEAS
jgi:hypothetical protein